MTPRAVKRLFAAVKTAERALTEEERHGALADRHFGVDT